MGMCQNETNCIQMFLTERFAPTLDHTLFRFSIEVFGRLCRHIERPVIISKAL